MFTIKELFLNWVVYQEASYFIKNQAGVMSDNIIVIT